MCIMVKPLNGAHRMFNQAKQNRTFEDVIFQIQEAILGEKLKPGDKLPGERKLREIFQVSRGTLREALRVLEQKGLIAIKTGVKGGAIVSAISPKLVNESLELLLQYQKVSLSELAEFRETVEGLIAAKAAQKATKEDINELRQISEEIKYHIYTTEPNWDELIKGDSKYHLTLARVAGNRIFESVLYTVYNNINRYFERFLPREIKIFDAIYQDLSNITAAIENKDSKGAQLLLIDHVKRFNRMMKTGDEVTVAK